MTILTIYDHIDVERAIALAGVLDRECADLVPGSPLPLAWQLLYFLERPRQGALGPDGHPLAGFPTPPKPGLRRMFAGGRIALISDAAHGRLRFNDEATLQRRIISQTTKRGTTGPLHFATVRDDISVGRRNVLNEERDIVYLPTQSKPGGAIANASLNAGATRRRVSVDPVLLFRFSALTYNAHRVHYDRDYARTHEGHRGLLVHGPLQALLMAESATELASSSVTRTLHFSYRLIAPLYDDDDLHVLAGHNPHESGEQAIWAQVVDGTGRITSHSTLRLSEVAT